MRVRLLAFASAQDAIGSAESTLELPAGSTVADLRRALSARWPGLARLGDRMAIGVDGELAAAESPIPDDAEIALLPPVSGG